MDQYAAGRSAQIAGYLSIHSKRSASFNDNLYAVEWIMKVKVDVKVAPAIAVEIV